MFLLQFSRESHAEIQSRSVFFLNLCGTQTSKGLHNQTLHLKQLEKEEMMNPRVSRSKEILIIRAEINAKETK